MQHSSVGVSSHNSFAVWKDLRPNNTDAGTTIERIPTQDIHQPAVLRLRLLDLLDLQYDFIMMLGAARAGISAKDVQGKTTTEREILTTRAKQSRYIIKKY